jgi:hypothetical protein
MGNLALIFHAPDRDFTLRPGVAARLAALGVTRVSLLHDEDSIAVVLEGWAFDSGGSASKVESMLAEGSGKARVLHELAQVNLSQT